MNGMADTGGDEEYSDDDLDALPAHTFEALQQQALGSTQNTTGTLPIRNTLDSARPGDLYPPQSKLLRVQDHPPPEHFSSDYGDLDEDDLDITTEDTVVERLYEPSRVTKGSVNTGISTQQELWRQQRYGFEQPIRQSFQRHAIYSDPHVADNGSNGDPEWGVRDEHDLNTGMMLDDPTTDYEQGPSDAQQADKVTALGEQVEKLLQERESLKQQLKGANDKVFAKAGEVSIVRTKLEKTSKGYESQLQTLQRERLAEKARHNAELAKIQAERERVATDNMFLQHNAGEKASFAARPPRNIQKEASGRGSMMNGVQNGNKALTPKKNIELPFRDGFESHEILPLSPSKSMTRSKPGTPKAGLKRKRKAEESPGQPLELSQPRQDSPSSKPQQAQKPVVPKEEVLVIEKEDKRFRFYQMVINHREKPGKKRSLEELSSFALPSKPNVALSTLLLDGISQLGTRPPADNFPASICSIVMSIWSECITATYYKPVHILLDLVHFILLTNPFTTAPIVTVDLVELIRLTAEINVVPRWNRLRYVRPPDTRGRTEMHDDICTKDCLQLLLLVAHDCSQKPTDIIQFWRCVRLDFLSVVLRPWQPLDDVQLILKLLCYSVQEGSFGTIADIADTGVIQTHPEQHIIDRFTTALVESPRVLEGEKSYNAMEIAQMRLQALALVETMCDSTYCAEALAKSPVAIGRLVRLMNDELNALYDHKRGHEYRAELVSQATRLLFHLTSLYAPLIDMKAKLSAVPGGANKYLIVLTRLTLGESIFLERDIEDDVRDCAQQMLENWVSPEESAELQDAFSSARR